MIDKLENFILNQPAQIDLTYFAILLILGGILGYILSVAYVKYGTTISNRKKFGQNFILLIITTTIVITIVKSSLALSLGLVGALSIVRFRAAIKEPEELVFLFIAIAFGLGLGAGQLGVTIIGFVIISLFIYTRHLKSKKEEGQNLFISISSSKPKELDLTKVNVILKKHCNSLHLKRFDESNENIEASFLIGLNSFEKFETLKKELKESSKDLKITYMDKISLI